MSYWIGNNAQMRLSSRALNTRPDSTKIQNGETPIQKRDVKALRVTVPRKKRDGPQS